MSIEQVCDAGSGEECLASLRTMFADRCRADASWLSALHEAGRAVVGHRERLRVLDEFSGDEVASALGWSLSMAGRLLTLADDLLTRLPEVHAAMAAGVLELGKARVFSEWTRELEGDHAHHVCAVVLPEAPRRNIGELITEVQAVAASLDPAWAQRRLEAAKRGASVFGASRGDRLRAPRSTVHDRAIVELQVPTAALADLDPDDHRAWAAVLRQAQARVAGLRTLTPDDHPATTRGDTARRRAGAELDRWTRTRDRCCVGVTHPRRRPRRHPDLAHARRARRARRPTRTPRQRRGERDEPDPLPRRAALLRCAHCRTGSAGEPDPRLEREERALAADDARPRWIGGSVRGRCARGGTAATARGRSPCRRPAGGSR